MIDELFDRVFVISMRSSTRRRDYIRRHFAEIGIHHYEFSDASVGADLDLEKLKDSGLVAPKPLEHGGVNLNPGEVAAGRQRGRLGQIARAGFQACLPWMQRRRRGPSAGTTAVTSLTHSLAYRAFSLPISVTEK